jgi:hypothetical protein
LAQLLKLNGASRVVIAANQGIKTKVARDLDCGDEYIELDRLEPEPQWAELKRANPHGFDIVVCGNLLGSRALFDPLYTCRLKRQAQKKWPMLQSIMFVEEEP